ncbi:unnamed protein product [Paramecium sonneborni]|uniref:Uncharacterized protein n=1 Tax=Paramecium sonneborni TaxID=65129 RepID=A0A8S1MRI1_9CILI|nr:unnamed protein product [Paramecium sonneborni]
MLKLKKTYNQFHHLHNNQFNVMKKERHQKVVGRQDRELQRLQEKQKYLRIKKIKGQIKLQRYGKQNAKQHGSSTLQKYKEMADKASIKKDLKTNKKYRRIRPLK